MKSLQRKDPLVEVIKEVFSVIKLAKIIKKSFSTTSVFGNGGFGGDFNGISTQLKKLGWPKVITDVFFIGALLTCQRTGACHIDGRLGVVKGACTR